MVQAHPGAFRFPRTPSFVDLAIRISIIALACLLLPAKGARADDYTYTYTGMDYTSVNGPFLTSESVTGTIVLSHALTPDLPLTDESPYLVSYSLSDGVQTFTNLNIVNVVSDLSFATDSLGEITAWELGIGYTDTQSGQFGVFTDNVTGTNGSVEDLGLFSTPSYADYRGVNSGDPGTWAIPAATPEPGTLSMFFSGLVGLGLLVGVKRYRGYRPGTAP